jgi:hypothetical protein
MRRKGIITIGGFFAALLVGVIGYAVWPSLFPPGEPVATLDLLARDARVAVDARQGERLFFRTDVETYPMGLKAFQRALRSSTVEISLTDPAGREELARCVLFNGTSSVGRSSGEGTWTKGMRNDCELALRAKGKHVVRARMTWSSAVSPTAARLEVRRAPAR